MSTIGRSGGRGIVVLGTPRSGTTLLRRLLDAHPEIVCPGETNLLSGCARLLREDVIAEGVRVGVLAGLGHAGFPKKVVLDRLREFAFSFHTELAKSTGKRRWAEKTAFDAFYLREIVELCSGHVQFVCLVRNGMDVVCSLQELADKNQGYLPELHDYVRQYPNFLEAFAHCWVDLTERILDLIEQRNQDACLLRYEDLVRQPEVELPKLFRFLGEAYPDDLIENAMGSKNSLGLGDWKTYGKDRLDPSSIGRGSRLSPRTRCFLGRILSPTLQRCGYETIPEPAEEDESLRQRRYEIGLMAQRLMGNAE